MVSSILFERAGWCGVQATATRGLRGLHQVRRTESPAAQAFAGLQVKWFCEGDATTTVARLPTSPRDKHAGTDLGSTLSIAKPAVSARAEHFRPAVAHERPGRCWEDVFGRADAGPVQSASVVGVLNDGERPRPEPRATRVQGGAGLAGALVLAAVALRFLHEHHVLGRMVAVDAVRKRLRVSGQSAAVSIRTGRLFTTCCICDSSSGTGPGCLLEHVLEVVQAPSRFSRQVLVRCSRSRCA